MLSKLHCLFLPLGLTVDAWRVSLWKLKPRFVACTQKKYIHAKTGPLRAKEEKMRSAERKSLKFQGDTGEDRRASSSKGLISMKMSLPLRLLPYGCHDTLAAWRMYSYRAVCLRYSVERHEMPSLNVEITLLLKVQPATTSKSDLTHSSGEGVYLNRVLELSYTVYVTFWTTTTSSNDILN